jgi:hypothetical protein
MGKGTIIMLNEHQISYIVNNTSTALAKALGNYALPETVIAAFVDSQEMQLRNALRYIIESAEAPPVNKERQAAYDELIRFVQERHKTSGDFTRFVSRALGADFMDLIAVGSLRDMAQDLIKKVVAAHRVDELLRDGVWNSKEWAGNISVLTDVRNVWIKCVETGLADGPVPPAVTVRAQDGGIFNFSGTFNTPVSVGQNNTQHVYMAPTPPPPPPTSVEFGIYYGTVADQLRDSFPTWLDLEKLVSKAQESRRGTPSHQTLTSFASRYTSVDEIIYAILANAEAKCWVELLLQAAACLDSAKAQWWLEVLRLCRAKARR